MQAWENLVPPSIQEKLDYKKLTFYLHVHFAALPLRTSDNTQVNHENEEGESEIDPNEQKTKTEEAVLEEQPDEKHLLEDVDGNRGMEVLRNFLETKGTEFSAESEFLPFYALPFVSEPARHPSFQELFTVSDT